MRAMVLTGPGLPFEERTVPDPIPEPGEAVARVLACGSGLTIHHTRAGRMRVRYPRIIGHEVTAEIVAVGSGVDDLEPDDAVTVYYYLNCGACRWCQSGHEPLCTRLAGNVGRDVDGGYADLIKLPARNFIKLPTDLDHRSHPAEVGVITDAIATPHKVVRHARIGPGDTVAVFGAGGGLGIHMVMMARHAGASVIGVDIAADKLGVCLEHGASATVDASTFDPTTALMDLTGGEGVDVVVDFVSSRQTLEAGARALGRGGRLVTLGGVGQDFTLSSDQLLKGELTVMGSRYASRREVVEALELVARGEIWPLVTVKRPLAEAEEVHSLLDRGAVTGRAALLVA